MLFKEKSFLKIDQKPNGSTIESLIEGETLLVGENPIYEWVSDAHQYGHKESRIYPAYHKGKKAWVHEWEWYPRSPCVSSGSGEKILSFAKGVEMLLQLGVYEHLFKREGEL